MELVPFSPGDNRCLTDHTEISLDESSFLLLGPKNDYIVGHITTIHHDFEGPLVNWNNSLRGSRMSYRVVVSSI